MVWINEAAEFQKKHFKFMLNNAPQQFKLVADYNLKPIKGRLPAWIFIISEVF